MLIDLHTHTSFSPDAKSSPEEMCALAAELGLERFAVTDHCDCNYWLPAEEMFPGGIPEGFRDEEMCGVRDYAPASIRRIAELKERYPFLLCGIELGQPLQNPSAAEQILAMDELDFVIGSHHMNAGCADFYWMDYRSMDISGIYRLLETCFEEICQMCRNADIDTLGHLTYPLRYIVGDCGIEVDMHRYDDIIREIFRTLAERGRGIEINTSGLRQKYGRTLPDREYVKLFKDCGGEILTIGSDAHCAADLAAGIPQGIDLARECGFRYVAYFEKRRAEFIKI